MRETNNKLHRYALAALSALTFALAISFPHLLSAQNHGITGEFAVTDAGAATYNIPLYAAPAAGSLDVRLALQYNSQSGNGVFGVGWNLTGVSSITRCPMTPAEEGERIGVRNNGMDRFCLDGQKLRAISGVYGFPGTEYRTAIDSYSKIIANGIQGGGPLSFTVHTKSGAILEFGSTADSRLEHTRDNTVRVWMVSQMRDRFSTAGNSNATAINFTYSKNLTLGEQLLQTVRYNNGQIKLNYEARPANDQILKYDDGIQLGSTNSRVSKIDIYDEPLINGARQLRLFKEYRISYIQSQATQRSLITSVQECGSAPSSTCLPATQLSYRNTSPLNLVQQVYQGGASALLSVVGDFEGKGKQSVKAFTGGEYQFGSDPFAHKSVIAWDVDGDGITDIGYISIPEEGHPRFNMYLPSGSALQPGEVPPCFADIYGQGISSYFSFTDFWGISESQNVQYLKINGAPTNAIAFRDWGPCQSIDMDGDGASELLFPKVGQLIVRNGLTLINAGSVLSPDSCILNDCSFQIDAADFNGDGKTDIAISRSNMFNNTEIKYSSGLGYLETQLIEFGTSKIVCTGDFNGDGRSDFLAANYGIPTLYLSTGNSFVKATQLNLSIYPWSVVRCADFNGDGLADVSAGGMYFWSDAPGGRDLLSEVANGLGHVQKIDYKNITDDSVYTKYTGAVRPQVDVQTPINVVSRAQSGNDVQGWNATGYKYEGLRADLHRRGTQGFAKVISTNEATQISVATSYRQNWPFTGIKERVLKTSSGITLEDTSYTYAQRSYSGATPSDQFVQVHLTQSTSQRKDLNGAFLSWETDDTPLAQYDAYGNPLINTKAQLDSAGAPTSRKTTTNSYDNAPANWLVGLLKTSSTRSENLRSLPSTVRAD